MIRKINWLMVAAGSFFLAVLVTFVVQIHSELTEPDHGVITKKDHQDPYSTTSCTGSGSFYHCTTTYHDECWELVYELDGEGGDVCVPGVTWDRYAVGDYYPSGEK